MRQDNMLKQNVNLDCDALKRPDLDIDLHVDGGLCSLISANLYHT